MSSHSIQLETLLSDLQVNSETGLTNRQAEDLRKIHGENRWMEKKKKTNLQRFINQFKDVMILILLAAAGISFGIAFYEGNSEEFFQPLLILLIVILNALMGVLQESKAEKALEALKSLSAPSARVLRESKEQVIDAALLVPGDIFLLEAGAFVPADGRLIRSFNLKSEESALTGESEPAEKDAAAQIPEDSPLGDRRNMVFSGCSITYGTGVAVVTDTGMHTEMGKIADLLNNQQETQTPLQKKLADMGKYLVIAALAACGVIVIVGLIGGMHLIDIFMTAVALAVSAIPEGLPAIVTIVLSIGVQSMVKRNAIIRRLPAVETLGSASVICSDKTGTLTQNRMTLAAAYVNGSAQIEKITGHDGHEIQKLLRYGTLCSDATVSVEGNEEKLIGDPTETAIVMAAYHNGITKQSLNKESPRLMEVPFDSDRKLMSTVNDMQGRKVVIVKGAFDVLEGRCIAGDMQTAKHMTEKMSEQALRVLAIAYRYIDALPERATSEELEQSLTFLGLVGMIDPPRPEVREAVRLCLGAGIKPVMITGDHITTACAIARDLGILTPQDDSVSGGQLSAMSDDELYERVESISVYARVTPQDKIRIVQAWQRRGHVVSMTGDGVNDAPALKAADIGCAMGITGTDVAKGAADMTLTDDNFATIVAAVREGRGIYDNIRKVVAFLLGTNIGEILTVLLAILIWKQSPLLSMQLLWINLVTDSLPAITLGMEAVEPHIMERKPKPKNEGLFAHGLGIQIAMQGCMFAALTLLGFYLGRQITGQVEGGRTVAFIVLSMSQVLHSFNMRSTRSLFQIGFFGNKPLNLAAGISVLLIALIVFTPLMIPFGLIPLSAGLYLLALGLAVLPIFIMELVKIVGLIRE